MGSYCYNAGSNKTVPTEVFSHLNRDLTTQTSRSPMAESQSTEPRPLRQCIADLMASWPAGDERPGEVA